MMYRSVLSRAPALYDASGGTHGLCRPCTALLFEESGRPADALLHSLGLRADASIDKFKLGANIRQAARKTEREVAETVKYLVRQAVKVDRDENEVRREVAETVKYLVRQTVKADRDECEVRAVVNRLVHAVDVQSDREARVQHREARMHSQVKSVVDGLVRIVEKRAREASLRTMTESPVTAEASPAAYEEQRCDTVSFIVPNGVKPGLNVTITHRDGYNYTFTVPDGAVSGTLLRVSFSQEPPPQPVVDDVSSSWTGAVANELSC